MSLGPIKYLSKYLITKLSRQKNVINITTNYFPERPKYKKKTKNNSNYFGEIQEKKYDQG